MNGLTPTEESWSYITDEFKASCQVLDVGELIQEPGFGLFEAMSAFEMMDPKMDAGMSNLKSKKPPLTFASAVDKGEIKLADFTEEELLTIMDGTLCCLASWLDGNSLVQTVFANMYLHNPYLIEDRYLKAFCIGTLKLTDKIRDLTSLAGVYEEEHFQPMTYGFNLAEDLSLARVGGMLKEVEDDISKSIRTCKGRQSDANDNQNSQEQILTSLQCRIRFMKNMLSTVTMLKYEANYTNQEEAIKSVKKLKELITMMEKLQTHPFVEHPLTLSHFDISSTSRLLPPSFPRSVSLLGFTETLNYFHKCFEQLEKVVCMSRTMGLVDTMEYFDKLSLQSPGVFVRSIALVHYLALPNSKVFNGMKLKDAIIDEMKAFNCPPPISSAFKSMLMANQDVKLMITAWLSSASLVTEGLCAAKCANRARQRERLAVLLDDLGILQTEADQVDTVIDTILRDKIGEKVMSQLAAGIGTWTLYLTTRTMISYLLLGLELELYDVREYCYVFWYLHEILYPWHASSMCRAENCLTEFQHLEQKGTNNKKKNKSKKSSKSVNPHQKQIFHSRTCQQLCGGFYFLLLGLKHSQMLPTTGDYKYDNEEVRYAHRFAPFSRVSTPAVVSYAQYADITRLHQTVPSGQLMEYMAQAFRNFQQAKAMVESVNFKGEKEALLTVTKNNIVVTKILADCVQKEQRRKVRFDFSVHKVFPMIKFV